MCTRIPKPGNYSIPVFSYRKSLLKKVKNLNKAYFLAPKLDLFFYKTNTGILADK